MKHNIDHRRRQRHLISDRQRRLMARANRQRLARAELKEGLSK